MRPPQGPPCRPRPASYVSKVKVLSQLSQQASRPASRGKASRVGKAIVYVDGFNLYYGMKAKHDRKYLWLDLFTLAQRMRQPDMIQKVRYFTAIVRGEPEAARNQETYLAALCAYRPQVEVTRGRFQKKEPRCRACGQRWLCHCNPRREYRTFEEKLTDVALGVAMVEDAALGVGDVTILVTPTLTCIPR